MHAATTTTAAPKAIADAAPEHRARRRGRQPGRQRLPLEHDRRAAAGRRRRSGGRSTTGRCRTALERIRSEHDAPATTPALRIHIIGFAKLAGDLIDGLRQVMAFFARRRARGHGRHLRLHALRAQHRAGDRLLAGRGGLAARAASSRWATQLDPFSMLVPFLVFAIGVSHGAQKMNGIMQDIGRGMHRLVAARYTFRRLFLAGLTALLADAVGFAVLMVIDIPVIRELALTASLGRRGADLHQPDAAAGAAVLRRRQPGGRAAQPGARRSEPRAAARRAVAPARPLHRAPLGRRRPSRSALVLGAAGFVVQPASADRRPGRRRARAASRLALQPRQRLHHRALRHLERRVRGDGEDAAGPVPTRSRR